MKLFLSKVRNWDVPVGPMQFSSSGWRENAFRQLLPGDRIVLAGTKSLGVPEDVKGNLLGAIEPSGEFVDTLDFIVPERSDDFTNGKYRWPCSLMNRRAWSLPPNIKLKDICHRKIGRISARTIVPLNVEEEERILALEWNEEELLERTVQESSRLEKKLGNRKRYSPPPTTIRSSVIVGRGHAYTYAMKIVGASPNAFKIGWAFDYQLRARQFNHASMPSLGGVNYEPIRFELWDTVWDAYDMEQALLDRLAKWRHPVNHEIVQGLSDSELFTAWLRITDKLRGA